MLKDYVNKFNNNDEEFIVQTISNDMAYDFLKENAPVLTCPDKVIEETFAFRLWTIRKHLKSTNDGVMMTEFLPPQPTAHGVWKSPAALRLLITK